MRSPCGGNRSAPISIQIPRAGLEELDVEVREEHFERSVALEIRHGDPGAVRVVVSDRLHLLLFPDRSDVGDLEGTMRLANLGLRALDDPVHRETGPVDWLDGRGRLTVVAGTESRAIAPRARGVLARGEERHQAQQ